MLTFVHIINQCSCLTCPEIAEWPMQRVSEAALMSFVFEDLALTRT